MRLGGLGFVPHRQTLKSTLDYKLYHPISASTVNTSASKYACLGVGVWGLLAVLGLLEGVLGICPEACILPSLDIREN